MKIRVIVCLYDYMFLTFQHHLQLDGKTKLLEGRHFFVFYICQKTNPSSPECMTGVSEDTPDEGHYGNNEYNDSKLEFCQFHQTFCLSVKFKSN